MDKIWLFRGYFHLQKVSGNNICNYFAFYFTEMVYKHTHIEK